MPTENRSSNTEMVSDLLPCPFCGEKPQITKHHREDIYSFMHRCQVLGPISWGFREDQQAHIEKWNARAQPAPQPHPEPIAWMVGTAIWWTKEEAERDAAETGLPIVGLGPMAGHGEVERCEARLHEVASLCASVEQERDALRTQLAEAECLAARLIEKAERIAKKLAEAHALLRDIDGWMDREDRTPGFELEKRMAEVFRSASAEPSAPCITPIGERCPGDGVSWCKACPQAPAEIDERAGFEAYALDKGWLSQHLKQRPDGNYEDWGVNPEWQAWKARAALERKQSTEIPEGYCVMPRCLTAKNGAKALLLGEFKLQVTRECPECAELEEPAEGCEICDGAGEYGQRHTIPWDQIKFIYSEAVKGLALKQ